ncbi:DUF1754-domain-containing protein [Hypoxylon sp. NC1633]|nr:DUF1754-domain-containing protein [Hypoxylon sp. NC1633]
MPADDYASVSGSGALKLKGGKVQKSKKKAKGKVTDLESPLTTGDKSTSKEPKKLEKQDNEKNVAEHKTDAERRHEEATRKKMMKMLEDPKLASEFRKTHKERVEGLNTYLSKLSEHHDMPKIGPG